MFTQPHGVTVLFPKVTLIPPTERQSDDGWDRQILMGLNVSETMEVRNGDRDDDDVREKGRRHKRAVEDEYGKQRRVYSE